MKNKKRGFSGEKLHKITISSVVLALALFDTAPVWGVTSEYINSQNNNNEEDTELVEELEDEELEDGVEEELETGEEDLELDKNGVEKDNLEKLEDLEDTQEEEKDKVKKEVENKEEGNKQQETGISTMSLTTNSEPNYVMATDEDFSGTVDGEFMYIGTDEYVAIPHVIKGVNVTSYDSMFEGTSVKGVASTNKNVTSMVRMFNDSQATSLDLSSFDTSNVTSMVSMFQNSQATSLDLSNFDTSSVTDMNLMFYGSQATSLDVSNFDTSSVTNMILMFYNSKATSIDLSSFDTSSVTDMSLMFYNSKATSIDLSSFDTSNVTDMSYMFRNSQATSLDLSSFDTSNVTDMYGMFDGSQATIGYARTKEEADKFNGTSNKPTSLTFYAMATDADFSGTTNGSFRYIGTDEYVAIPHVIKGVNVTSYNSMFRDTSVKGVASTNKNVTNMSSMFYNSKATSMDLSSFDTSSVTSMYGMFESSKATSLDLSSFDTSSVTDMGKMFDNSKATSIDLSSFDTSSVTDMGSMFYNSQATSLDLSLFDTSSVTYMGYMFFGSKATSLDVSNFDTSSVTSMGSMFSSSSATSLDLSNFDTSSVTGMNGMFQSSQATSLDLSNFDTSSVTSMGGMFQNSQATSLDLSSFDTSNVTSMGRMFEGSQATIGYARTQADADKFNGTSNKPPRLIFYVYVYEEDAPTGTITGNPTTWTNQDITLTFNASDVNGVKRVQSPDGTWVNGSSTTHTVTSNGAYTFKAEDNIGNIGTYSVTVDRIDKTVPEITVNGNPTEWFRDYELELEVVTSDDHSGVKQVTLPDGTVVTGDDLDTLTYKVTDNGSYEFIVEDNVGNKTTYTEEVTMLEKEFSVKVTDTDNKPLAGAEFELYRDGELIETVVSDNSGLVEFGTVYTSGDYEIRQTRVPEGYKLNNNILEVDVADDDINITNYRQSEVLPSTGTKDTLIMQVMGLVTATVIAVIDKMRRKLSK